MIFQCIYSINNASGAIFHQFPEFSVTTGEHSFLGVIWAFFQSISQNDIAVLKRKNQEMKQPSNTDNQRMMLKSRIFIKNLQDSANNGNSLFA
jgi:hypothetical protein